MLNQWCDKWLTEWLNEMTQMRQKFFIFIFIILLFLTWLPLVVKSTVLLWCLLLCPLPLGHLRLPQVVVDHGEVQAQLLHVALVALEEEQVAVHLRVQRGQVVDVHVGAGPQELGQEEAGEGQLYQHVLVQRLEEREGERKRHGGRQEGQGYEFSLVNSPHKHRAHQHKWENTRSIKLAGCLLPPCRWIKHDD